MTTNDYNKFRFFFDKIIRDYHGNLSREMKHITDWDTGFANYDVRKLGQDELSMRVCVGRNLVGFNLPGYMSKDERIKFERMMMPAFDELIKKYGGKVHSLTPDFGNAGGNPNLISLEHYKELVDKHIMFKDMAVNLYLKSAGISDHWPHGRGCWQSEDNMRIIWFGEEDQLRIMCMKKSSDLLEVFSNLNEMLCTVESIKGIKFAKDENYGYVTSCPSNLGTGMQASVHVKIPNLTSDGTDKKAKEICKALGLSVRGTGGEHAPIGTDGTVEISPSARLFIKECEIISKLYGGIEKLMAIENPSAEPISEHGSKNVEQSAENNNSLSARKEEDEPTMPTTTGEGTVERCTDAATSEIDNKSSAQSMPSPRSLNMSPSPILSLTN